jgi:hypothetical protein
MRSVPFRSLFFWHGGGAALTSGWPAAATSAPPTSFAPPGDRSGSQWSCWISPRGLPSFRGGKGVATTCGVFLLLAPLATAIALGGFVVTLWLSRYVSLASVIAALLLPSMAYTTHTPAGVLGGIAIVAGLVLYRHRGNLVRLRAGTERRLGQRV